MPDADHPPLPRDGRVEVDRLVEMWTDEPGSKQNIASWCKDTGHELVEQSSDDSTFRYVVRRQPMKTETNTTLVVMDVGQGRPDRES